MAGRTEEVAVNACSGDCMSHINLGASQAAWEMLLCG